MVGAEEVCDAAVTKAAGLRSQNSAVDGPIHKKGSIRAIFFGFVRYENDGKMCGLEQHRVPLKPLRFPKIQKRTLVVEKG